MRKFLALLLILSVLLGAVQNVSAQQSLAFAELYPADVSAFPKVSASLDVFDGRGIFASGLKPEAVTIYEDGQPLKVDSLVETAIPLQLVVAVNQGQPLDARDSTGASRFQRISQTLAEWAQKLPADLPDDFSLVSQAGPVINHANAADFIVGLNGFKPDFRAASPNLLSLAAAIDIVSAQTPQVGMKRAILLITPHSDDFNIAATLEPHLQRALQNHIRVFVWFVDLESAFKSTSAAAFGNLAAQTGGSMFTYSGIERFPDPEAYFSALRRVYALTYSSRLNAAGEHRLAAKINLSTGALDSPEQKFSVDVQPPNPFPLTNDIQITRRAPEDASFGAEVLLPAAQEIKIIIEFPDGHPRPLTRTTLYVDNAIMDENTAEPFDVFTWDISAYEKTGEHQIMVEAVDTLGLQKISMSVPVTVTVVQPLGGGLGLLARYRTPITFGAILLAGLILFLILLSGRLRAFSIRASKEARRAEADPLTQSVNETSAAPAEKNKKPRIVSKQTGSNSRAGKDAEALLMRLTSDGRVAAAAPIPLVEKEIVFGTDPVQCAQILDDPSISSVHARLRITDDGGYLLQDNNSVAGTWVNYDLVPREGCRLAHGDILHFGRLLYRFTLKTPPEISKPTITIQTIEE
ncbi:MAG: FHA domain-containing protein [Anaerolineales bacterium]|nr:FHA domain-containing protein [Anaerolineales bacterium]